MNGSPFRFAGLAALVMTAAYAEAAGEAPASESAAPAIHYVEVSRKTVTLKDHTVTLIRVRAPVLPEAPPRPAPPPPTPEEQAEAERLAQKACVTLNLSATVYLGPHPVTGIRWRDRTDGREYRAWSNIDFRYLTQLSTLETETTVYQWFPFVESYWPSDWPAGQKPPIPPDLGLSATEAEYVVDAPAQNLSGQQTILDGLDHLHAYYQLHYAELKAAYEKQEADTAAREKELREHPPKVPDTVIYFWPIKSRQK